MSLVVGIDFSTHAIDIVAIPYEEGYWGEGWTPRWTHCPLTGSDAFDRSRSIVDAMSSRTSEVWDDVIAIGIEEPQMRGSSMGAAYSLYRVQGAVLACLPVATLVQPWLPSAWRAAVGLSGNAKKDAVQEWVLGDWPDGRDFWTQDACDAYCIALATHQAIERTPERRAA